MVPHFVRFSLACPAIISKVDHLYRCMDHTLFPSVNHSFISFAHLLVWLFYRFARIQRIFWVLILFPYICSQISSNFRSSLSLFMGTVVLLEFVFVYDVAWIAYFQHDRPAVPTALTEQLFFFFFPSKGCNSTSVIVTPDAEGAQRNLAPARLSNLPHSHAREAADTLTFSNTPSFFCLLVAFILPAAWNTLPTVYCTAASFSSLRFRFKCHLLPDRHRPLAASSLSPSSLSPFILFFVALTLSETISFLSLHAYWLPLSFRIFINPMDRDALCFTISAFPISRMVPAHGRQGVSM